jgi:hypothetical protein
MALTPEQDALLKKIDTDNAKIIGDQAWIKSRIGGTVGKPTSTTIDGDLSFLKKRQGGTASGTSVITFLRAIAKAVGAKID